MSMQMKMKQPFHTFLEDKGDRYLHGTDLTARIKVMMNLQVYIQRSYLTVTTVEHGCTIYMHLGLTLILQNICAISVQWFKSSYFFYY